MYATLAETPVHAGIDGPSGRQPTSDQGFPMRTMPLKPLKKVRVDHEDPTRYTVTVLSPVRDQAEFEEIIREDVRACLGPFDGFVNADWETRSFTLVTQDFYTFKHKLIYRRYLVRDE
jgi:hypothetical protein